MGGICSKGSERAERPTLLEQPECHVEGKAQVARLEDPNEAVEVAARDTVDKGQCLCMQNIFYESAGACKTQQFCNTPDEITAAWLGDALNAEVLSFTPVVCAQGNMGATVLIKDIKYGTNTAGRHASVAIKMHVQTEAGMPIVRMLNAYSRELYFYTSFANDVPMKSPKCFGVWTDGNGVDMGDGAVVESFNLMMENLAEEHTDFDTAKNIPTTDEFKRIILSVLPMHVKYWKHPIITQKPFSDSGTKFDHYEKLRPLMSMLPKCWPAVRAKVPELAGWGTTWPAEFNKMLSFIDRFALNHEEYSHLTAEMEKLHQSRPMTLIHGDLNAGNIWKSKANAEDLVFTDFQLLKMAPIGFDFGIMLVILPQGPSGEETTALMHAYLEKLPSEIREEYTYTMLRDDFRCQALDFMVGLAVVSIGQLDPASMDATKYEFTWKSYWPSVYQRLLQLYHDEDLENFAAQLLRVDYRSEK
jgi:hypothetical protein